MNARRWTYGLLLVAWLIPAPAAAQNARVDIDLDRHIAQVGERVQVTVSVVVAGQMGQTQFIPPSFKGFRVLANTMTSSNIEIVPFRGIRRRESRTYTVVPLTHGTLSVGPAAVRVGRTMVRSPVVKLRVLRRGAPAPTPPAPPPQPADPPPEQPADPRGTVFITGETRPSGEVYQGQQLVATWSLITRSRVLNFRHKSQPTTDDFWSEDLKSPSRLRFEERVIGGQVHYAAVLVRRALFAQKQGKLTIGPMAAHVRTLETFSHEPVLLKSPALTLDVKPLPAQGRPADFHPGNVGRYVVAASLDRHEVKGGEAVTLKLVVRGRGNLRQLKPPTIKELAGFRVYEPKVSERLQREGGISGEKVVEYLLMPVRSGRLSVPPLVLQTFDPVAGRYRRQQTRALQLNVVGPVPSDAKASKKARTNVLARTIRPPRPATLLSYQRSDQPLDSRLFWALVLLPVAALLLLSGGERLRTHLRRETPGRQRRAAARRTNRHLKQAKEARRDGDKAAFFAAIAAGLRDLLDHKLNLRSEGLTRVELRELMLAAGFAAALVDAVIEELENCDFARFAPSASGEAAMDQTLDRARKLLAQLGRLSTHGKGPR